MATKTIPLTDGDGLVTGYATVDYEGNEDNVATFTAEENIGLDREGNVLFSTTEGEIEVSRKVFQRGIREKFTDDDFFVADGGTFHVLIDYEVFEAEDDDFLLVDESNLLVQKQRT